MPSATFSRQRLFQLTVALQAAVLAAACSYDRSRPHPLLSHRAQMAHLLRRAGFGASKEMLDEFTGLSQEEAVDRLLNYDGRPDQSEERLRLLSLDPKKLGDLQRSWLLRMIFTRSPLQEKMTLFWHGLLTSGTAKVGLPNPTPENPNPPHYMLDQHTFFRKHALDNFGTLLLGISRDPAMMIWLDSQTNNKGKPNENYARELMELFSLGIGNYTEQDVREVARAFTGWGLDKGAFAFKIANHDTGLKTVLGKTSAFDGGDVVKLLVSQPAAAKHLSRKLFEFFVHADPTDEDLDPLVKAFQRTGGEVKPMLRALFLSPAFYSPKAYRALIKSPVDFVVGAIRALGVVTDATPLPGVTTRMGQALFNPPNVAGWPGGVSWLNTTTWLERVNFANSLLVARDDGHTMAPPFASIVEREKLFTPATVIDYFGDLLLDGQITDSMRRALLDYMASGIANPGSIPLPAGAAAGANAKVATVLRPTFVDQKVRGAVYLMLASPEYQLA